MRGEEVQTTLSRSLAVKEKLGDRGMAGGGHGLRRGFII